MRECPIPSAIPSPPQPRGKLQIFLSNLGPGVISGAANQDPSCIVTYSLAGAAYGYATLWTSLFCLPFLAAVQLMCARLGMVSGRGLVGAVRVYYPKWVLFSTCSLLTLANIVTLGADLGGMAEVTQMVIGVSPLFWILVYAGAIAGSLFFLSYWQIERLFKWLCLLLFAYLVAAFLARPDWPAALSMTVLPGAEFSRSYLSIIVAILGATMSPYFLFWQVSQQVEEEYAMGRRTLVERKGASRPELERSGIDVFAGAFISKLITYFITLTTGATLFWHGQKNISTAKEAAAALEPLAGPAAYWLFALGVIGTGLLSIPTMAGSAAYAVAEAARWKASLHEKPRFAPDFYVVLLLSLLLGLGFIYMGFHVVQMLFWASVLNGLLAPASILLVVLLTSSRQVMGVRVTPGWMRLMGWASFLLTGAAALTMLATFLLFRS